MDSMSYQQPRYLTSKLQDAKADDYSKQSILRSREGRDDNSSESLNEASHLPCHIQERQTTTPPAAPSSWRGMARSSEATPDRRLSAAGSVPGGTPRSLGARDIEDQIDKLLKQNFDLKLEVFHLREWKEKADRKLGEAQRLSEENEELRRANQNLAIELKRRDQAVDEAVVMICDLEERLKKLEEELELLKGADDSQDERSLHDPNTSITRKNSQSSGAAVRARQLQPNQAPEARLSFLEESKADTNTLRSIYFEDGRAVRPIPSHATIASRYTDDEENETEEDDTPVSPDFSVIGETELQSIYGDHNRHERPDDTSGLHPVSFPTRNEMTAEGSYARVHQWVADGQITHSNDDATADSLHDGATFCQFTESGLRTTFKDVKQGSRHKDRGTKKSDQPLPTLFSNAKSTQHGTDLPASKLGSNADQGMTRGAQMQSKEDKATSKKVRKKHHPKPSVMSTRKTRVSPQYSNTSPPSSTASRSDSIASRSSQDLQDSLHDSYGLAGCPILAKHVSDNLHSHDRYEPVLRRPKSRYLEEGVLQRRSTKATRVDKDARMPRTQTEYADVPTSIHTGPAYISCMQMGRAGSFVNQRGSSTTSIPVLHSNQSQQSRPVSLDQTPPPLAHALEEDNRHLQPKSSFGVDSRVDPSLRRRASLRDRVRISLGRRASNITYTKKPTFRRNSITWLFGFDHADGHNINEGSKLQSMHMDCRIDVGNVFQNNENQCLTNPSDREPPSQQSSIANDNSTSSGRATRSSNHSNPSTGTSFDTGKVCTSSVPSSGSRGVTVTTVRLPFATVKTKKRNSFSRKLSLSGPTIETRDNGSMIGFPRRGKDGRVAYTAESPARSLTGVSRNEVS